MPLPFLSQQESGRTKVRRFTLLCVTALLTVGFSNHERGSMAMQEAPRLRAAEPAQLVATPGTLAQLQPLLVVASLKVAPTRPASYAQESSLDAVLGDVSSWHWMRPSLNSPDKVRDELPSQQQPKSFRGVGFPDIQTHRVRALYFDPTEDLPHRWNQMISWRDHADEEQISKPIPYVRCMGLSPQAVARRADKFESLIIELAIEHNVSASLIKAVVTEESCFNTKALSPAGAQGLMQLMPNTASWLKVKDPNNPEDNLRAGVRYLAYLKGKFKSRELVLAAYNAGPGNVKRYDGIPPFAETQAYVQKVQSYYRRYVAATRLATDS